MTGHRVEVTADLVGPCVGGLRSPIEPGHRSTLFVFERLGEDEEPMHFGAVVEDVASGGVPGGGLVAVVWFWADLAEVYATAGTSFELSYAGRTVGRGEVVEVIRDLENPS